MAKLDKKQMNNHVKLLKLGYCAFCNEKIDNKRLAKNAYVCRECEKTIRRALRCRKKR